MHADEKTVSISALLRLGGTLTGAVLGAFGAAFLFFVAALLDLLGNAITFPSLLSGFTFAGACIGFASPRQILDSLWFFFPEIFEKH
jgi:hypothetical protein